MQMKVEKNSRKVNTFDFENEFSFRDANKCELATSLCRKFNKFCHLRGFQ